MSKSQGCDQMARRIDAEVLYTSEAGLGIEHSETKLCISTLNDWEVDGTTERPLSYLSNRFNVAMLFDITRNSYVMEEIRPA